MYIYIVMILIILMMEEHGLTIYLQQTNEWTNKQNNNRDCIEMILWEVLLLLLYFCHCVGLLCIYIFTFQYISIQLVTGWFSGK